MPALFCSTSPWRVNVAPEDTVSEPGALMRTANTPLLAESPTEVFTGTVIGRLMTTVSPRPGIRPLQPVHAAGSVQSARPLPVVVHVAPQSVRLRDSRQASLTERSRRERSGPRRP